MFAYLRFQTSVRCPYAKRPLGVFCAAGLLQDEGRVEECFREPLDEALRWFNKHLTVPRIRDKHERSVFWFRTDHQQFVSRLWDIVAILIEHDLAVGRVTTNDPGMIVYRDDYQVAAVPSKKISREISGRL